MKALAFLIGTFFILTFAMGAFAQVDNEVVAPDSPGMGLV